MIRDIIVIGTSAGGIDALTRIVRHLPKDFSASVFIVLHTAPESPMILAQILDRAGPYQPSILAKVRASNRGLYTWLHPITICC